MLPNLVRPMSVPTQEPPSAAATIELLRQSSLVTVTQQELERRIVSGEFAAGTKLNEVDVATSLGVSRGPVREAFRALGQMGLVRVEKNRGVFVREVSLHEADEFYELRGALEGLIGALCAQRIQPDELAAMRGLVRRMHTVARTKKTAGKAEAYFALNLAFHDSLAHAARNQALLTAYQGVIKQLDLYRRATLAGSVDSLAHSTAEHEAIVDAVAARDAVRAQALLTQHVHDSRTRLHHTIAPSRQP
jgi:phosphonate utilization transcriptional regulator